MVATITGIITENTGRVATNNSYTSPVAVTGGSRVKECVGGVPVVASVPVSTNATIGNTPGAISVTSEDFNVAIYIPPGWETVANGHPILASGVLVSNTGAPAGTTVGPAGGAVHNKHHNPCKSLDVSVPPNGKCPAFTAATVHLAATLTASVSPRFAA